MVWSAVLAENGRSEPRDEVFHRTRVRLADGRQAPVVVVNLSPGGIMARLDGEIAKGDRVTVTLPVIGELAADVRWALGGRIGCQFERPVPVEVYYRLLGAVGGRA